MSVLLLMILFVFGIFIGSFLNVLVDRFPKSENPLKGRSHCDRCKATLSPIDLIPLISYLLLKGKCRYCSCKMSGYYPLIEITTGFLFAITGMVVFGFAPGQFVYNTYIAYLLVYLLFLNSIFIVVFFTDLKYGLIPFNAVLIGVLVTFGWHIWTHEAGMSILNYIFSAGGSFVAFLSIFAITKGKGMGFGDVMYVFLMGAILGFPKVIVAFYISFISGAVISLLLILLKKKKMKGGTIPFGPFLVSGTVISLFWGDIILKKILPYLLG